MILLLLTKKILVLDSTIGQNTYSQLEAFNSSIGITGVIMTKLDSSAKGGSLIGISKKYQTPIYFIGVGEKTDDLVDFNAKDFINALIGENFGEKMKATLNFYLRYCLLAVFFTVNSVENIKIVDSFYSIFFSIDDKFLKATFFLVLTSLIAIPVAWYIDRKVPWMPIVTGIFVLFFGGLTLSLQDPDFIKLKPTIINLVFATLLLLGGLKFNKIFLKIAFQAFKLDDLIWKKLTLRWSFFFVFLAVLNEIVWRNYTSDQWVFFKVWIIFPLTILFMVFFILPLINKNIKKMK